jgi:hypothetical protein
MTLDSRLAVDLRLVGSDADELRERSAFSCARSKSARQSRNGTSRGVNERRQR